MTPRCYEAQQGLPALRGIHWCKVCIVSSSELNISSFRYRRSSLNVYNFRGTGAYMSDEILIAFSGSIRLRFGMGVFRRLCEPFGRDKFVDKTKIQRTMATSTSSRMYGHMRPKRESRRTLLFSASQACRKLSCSSFEVSIF